MQLVETGLISTDDDVRPHISNLAELRVLKGFSDDGKPILDEDKKPITPQ